jgi:hypothetical protein
MGSMVGAGQGRFVGSTMLQSQSSEFGSTVSLSPSRLVLNGQY